MYIRSTAQSLTASKASRLACTSSTSGTSKTHKHDRARVRARAIVGPGTDVLDVLQMYLLPVVGVLPLFLARQADAPPPSHVAPLFRRESSLAKHGTKLPYVAWFLAIGLGVPHP
jgi:hypothetical protein